MELKTAILIQSIEQKDNHHFEIKWTDGRISCLKLSDLQRKCPCVQCSELRQQQEAALLALCDDDVRAIRIQSVGRYAIRIDFTSGCSNGIYSFDQLRQG